MHSKFNCADRNLDLDTSYTGKNAQLDAWPTAHCRGEQQTCAEKNGAELRLDYKSSVYECHCRAGFFGKYGEDSTLLQECLFCPKYATSTPGTSDIAGCFCQAGTYDPDEVGAAVEGAGVVCHACGAYATTTTLPANNEPTQLQQTQQRTHYCPGGPRGKTIYDFVHNTVVKPEMQDIMPVKAGAPIACQTNTSTRHDFASSAASCIPRTDMRYDSALGYMVFCDIKSYSSPQITQWLESMFTPCLRQCRPPHSVMQPATGGACRCNSDRGYGLNLLSERCQCQPGWYTLSGKPSGVCLPCPKNSHCDGSVRKLCAVQFESPEYSETIDNCTCLPGFQYSVRAQKCLYCTRGNKCPGGLTQSIACRGEEICALRRTFMPRACPRGTSKSHFFKGDNNYVDNQDCMHNGIIDDYDVQVLYANIIQKDELLYHIANMPIGEGCTDTVFQENLRLVTSQLWPMPMVGFFGAFQWLCGTDRVFTHGTGMPPPPLSLGAGSSNLHGAFACSGTVSLDGLETRFLMHAGLAIVAFHHMGMEGFISESYHDLRISLQAPEDHLLWNVFLTCPWDSDLGNGRRGDTGDTSLAPSSPTTSELDRCFRCHLRPAGGFLMLGTFTPFFLFSMPSLGQRICHNAVFCE